MDLHAKDKTQHPENVELLSAQKLTSSAATDILRFDRWGQANGQGSMRVLFVPVASGVASHATTTLCINSGMRVDIRRGDVTC